MKVCNLTEGPVILSGDFLECSGVKTAVVSELEVIGSSLVNSIQVSNANIVLALQNAFINTTSAVTISSSTVRFILAGASVFYSQGRDSAGLGCSSDSNVTIEAVSGGSLSAVGGSVSAGIGSASNSSCGSVTVLNGSLSGLGGIGLGLGESGGASWLGRLTIYAGDIEARGTYCGIGSGRSSFNSSAIGNVTIASGNITASSSSGGSGIGTGDGYSNGTSMIGNLTIVSGNITASVSVFGSAIGTGMGYSNGTSMIGNLTIVNGNITASSSSGGSGIGTGLGENGSISMIETLSILGGRIRSSGTESGIGSGFDESEVKLLMFARTVILFCTVTNTTKFPINASSIVLFDTSLTITTPRSRVFGVYLLRQGSLNLNVAYEVPTTAGLEPLWLLNSTFLQIGSVSLPLPGFWTFCLSGVGDETCIDIESAAMGSLLFFVPSQGNYSIRAILDHLIGFLETMSGRYIF
jgi:hypothetical protein